MEFMGVSLADLIGQLLSDAPPARAQVQPEEQHTFSSRHALGHYVQDQIGQFFGDILQFSNAPYLLAGNPTADNRTITVSAQCDVVPDNAVTWDVMRGDERLMRLTLTMYPTPDAPAE